MLAWRWFHESLGANPIEAVTHGTGDWTLRLLLVTLAITPLRELSGWEWPARLGRMLGLFVFFYALLHFATYLWLDQFFDIQAILKDIVKRPFIGIGFASFLLLIPLAATSSQAMMRRLGSRWHSLHRLTYLIAAGGVVHYLWLVKKDITQPLIYGAILGVLGAYRVYSAHRRRRAKPFSTSE